MDNRTNAHTDPNSPDYLPYLVVGSDPGMSGWGMASSGKSYAAWACAPAHVDELLSYVSGRRDMKRVRYVAQKGYRCPRNGHLSIYVAGPEQLGMELLFRPDAGAFGVYAKGRDLYLWSAKDEAFRAQARRPDGQRWRWSECWPQLVREWASGARAPELEPVILPTWRAWWANNRVQVLADLSTEAARLTEEAKRLAGQV